MNNGKLTAAGDSPPLIGYVSTPTPLAAASAPSTERLPTVEYAQPIVFPVLSLVTKRIKSQIGNYLSLIDLIKPIMMPDQS